MPSDTRERLIEAAVNVIATHGEQAIKVRDIAAQAGVTEPSIYHYFGDRNGLIIEAQAARYGAGQRAVAETFVAAANRCRTAAEFVALVRTSLDAAHQAASAHRRFTRVNVLGSAEARPELVEKLAAQQREANAVLGEALSVAQTRGFVRPDLDCEMAAAWVIGATTGRILIELDPDTADSAVWNTIAADAVLAVLGHPCAAMVDWDPDAAVQSAGL